MSLRTTLVSLLLVSGGCGQSADPVVFPNLDGKADVLSQVDDHGRLSFGGEASGEFDSDLQFHGYRVAARAGSKVTLDVTHKGSSSKLDTTLFIYGPRTGTGFGDDAIVFDDNDGWGKLSRLDNFTLFQDGEYLVVVGTANAQSRGKFRLTLECDSDESCALVEEPSDELCPDTVFVQFEECVQELMFDGFSYESASEDCFDPLTAHDTLDFICQVTTTQPEYCVDDDIDRTDLLSECAARVDTVFDISAPFAITGTTVTGSDIPDLEDEFDEFCDGLCSVDVSAFHYDANPSDFGDFARASVEAYRATLDFGFEFVNRGEVTLAHLEGRLDSTPELFDAITEFGGNGPITVGLAESSFQAAPSVDAFRDLYVVTFDNSKIMVVVDITVIFD